MTREDLSIMAFFVIVPPLALLLFVLSVVAIAFVPRHRRVRFIVCAAVFTGVGMSGALITAWVWGVGFDYADAGKPVPHAIDRSMAIGFFAACASYAGVLATGILAALTRTRLRVTQEIDLMPAYRPSGRFLRPNGSAGQFIHEAPTPGLAGLKAPHDRVAGLGEMPGSVLFG